MKMYFIIRNFINIAIKSGHLIGHSNNNSDQLNCFYVRTN